jgi:hypothetical protein
MAGDLGEERIVAANGLAQRILHPRPQMIHAARLDVHLCTNPNGSYLTWHTWRADRSRVHSCH